MSLQIVDCNQGEKRKAIYAKRISYVGIFLTILIPMGASGNWWKFWPIFGLANLAFLYSFITGIILLKRMRGEQKEGRGSAIAAIVISGIFEGLFIFVLCLSMIRLIRNMDATKAYNIFEGILWLGFSIVFFIPIFKRDEKHRLFCFLGGMAFIAASLSEFVEAHTGAWWKPWWLFAWKACLGISGVLMCLWYIKITPTWRQKIWGKRNKEIGETNG